MEIIDVSKTKEEESQNETCFIFSLFDFLTSRCEKVAPCRLSFQSFRVFLFYFLFFGSWSNLPQKPSSAHASEGQLRNSGTKACEQEVALHNNSGVTANLSFLPVCPMSCHLGVTSWLRVSSSGKTPYIFLRCQLDDRPQPVTGEGLDASSVPRASDVDIETAKVLLLQLPPAPHLFLSHNK